MLPAYRLFPIAMAFLYFGSGSAYASPTVNSLYAISPKKDTAKTKTDTTKKAPKTFELKPVLGLGTGMFSYFGAVTSLNSKLQNPMTSRIGFDLTYAQKITPAIELNLYALFGKLSVNQHSNSVNWNFLSEIRGGGAHLLFKILPKQSLTPYVTIGAESFEFLTKTDMYDNFGNKYYYWSDGTIRNIAQTAPNAASASVIYRNYTYETDMRALNLGNTGKYPLQTYAIPFGLGFMFHIGPKADFLIGSTLHYTFTKHIDGYGDSIKAKGNDMFLMTSISVRFDLTRKKKSDTGRGGYLPESLEGVDFAELMNDDYDHDGVRDWDDSCAGTPKGVKVDARGCPVDGDNDAVPDYLDKQENTPAGALVDIHGVALTDSAMLWQYLLFTDTTGAYAQIEIQNTIGAAKGVQGKNINYTIQLGKFCKGVPPDIMDKLLSIPDVQSTTLAPPDSCTVYTVGRYNDYNIAKQRQQQLIQAGLPDAKVVYKKGKDFIEANGPVGAPNTQQQGNNNAAANNNAQQQGNNQNQGNNAVAKNDTAKANNNTQQQGNNQANNNAANNANLPPAGNMIYRIQLGAYSHKLSRDIFANVDDLVEVKTENGFYTYSAGSFTNFQDAVNYKMKLITEGFPDTFIKAYQNGKRVPLKDAGATFIKPTKEDLSEKVTHESSTLDKSQIRFKVQVGVFKGNPPQDMAERFKTLSDLSTDRDASGMTHYLVGSYTDFKSAQNMRDKLAAEPLLKSAFVVAYFKDEPIPLQQALDIMKK